MVSECFRLQNEGDRAKIVYGPEIFELIAAGKIDPLVTVTLPLLEARQALTRLASGTVQGKIVLIN
jgi:NADPH:quinone reductase-like Zn-dependent oxidoreductase